MPISNRRGVLHFASELRAGDLSYELCTVRDSNPSVRDCNVANGRNTLVDHLDTGTGIWMRDVCTVQPMDETIRQLCASNPGDQVHPVKNVPSVQESVSDRLQGPVLSTSNTASTTSEALEIPHPAFLNFQYNNVNEVTGATMTLGAPVPPFRVFCVAKYPAHPYRLEIFIDLVNASYKEIDRSDQPEDPGVWSSRLTSVVVRMYSPTKDGESVTSYGVQNINNGLVRSGASEWYYWRSGILYDCISDNIAGELSADLIEQLKTAAYLKPIEPPHPAHSIESATFCATVRNRSFATVADAARARALCARSQ